MELNHNNFNLARSFYDANEIVSFRGLEEIPWSISKDLYTISLKSGFDKELVPENRLDPFGSYINRVSDYYGDIDGIQLISHAKSKEEIISQTTKSIVNIVKKINKSKNKWFSEIKAGIDKMFYFDIGKCVNGIYRFSDRLIRNTEILYKNGLLSDIEYKVIHNVIDNKFEGNGDDYDIIFNLFRKKWLLRWTDKEILQKYKLLPRPDGDIKYRLEDAISDNTILKIDMLAYNDNNKFIEVTNFIMIGWNKGKEFIPINIDPETHTPFYLRVPIEELYYSNYHYNPFKVVKRAFAFLKYIYRKWDTDALKENKTNFLTRGITKQLVEELLRGYADILDSRINILYTIVSELDTIKLIMERVPNPPIKKINNRIDMLRDPLSNVLEIDDEGLRILASTDGLFDQIMDEKDKQVKLKMIIDTMKLFKDIINFWTIAYFDQLGLNPPSEVILPIESTYDWSIIRTPESHPINPLDMAIAEAEGKKGGSITSSIFRKVANAYRSRNKEKLPDGRPRVRPLRDGEYHWLHGNYIGPGTHIWDPEVRNYPPYNDVDNCARDHDIAYEKAVQLPDGERQRAIIEADKEIIQCVAKYPNQEGSTAARLGINSKMKLGEVLPMVSNAIFKQISSGRTKPKPKLIDPREKPKRGRGRQVKSASEIKDPRLLAPGSAPNRLRPGEDPEVAKTALKDAIGLVKSAFKGDPAGVAEAVKEIGTHFVDIATKKEDTPYERYKKIHGSSVKNSKKRDNKSEQYSEDGKKIWILD